MQPTTKSEPPRSKTLNQPSQNPYYPGVTRHPVRQCIAKSSTGKSAHLIPCQYCILTRFFQACRFSAFSLSRSSWRLHHPRWLTPRRRHTRRRRPTEGRPRRGTRKLPLFLRGASKLLLFLRRLLVPPASGASSSSATRSVIQVIAFIDIDRANDRTGRLSLVGGGVSTTHMLS